MCKHRENFQKFKCCTEYANYIVSTIKSNQSSFDEEFGKGKRTIIGVAGKDGNYIIDKKGSVVTTVGIARELNNGDTMDGT